MVKRSPPNFPGILGKPIPYLMVFPFGVRPDGHGKERNAEFYKRVAEIRLEKLFDLLEHYKIPKSAKHRWQMLSFHLAIDCVRGFQVVDELPRRARPKGKWAKDLAARICPEVDAIRARKPQLSILAAIKIMRLEKPEDWGMYSATSLETRYHESKKKSRSRLSISHASEVGMLIDISTRSG